MILYDAEFPISFSHLHKLQCVSLGSKTIFSEKSVQDCVCWFSCLHFPMNHSYFEVKKDICYREKTLVDFCLLCRYFFIELFSFFRLYYVDLTSKHCMYSKYSMWWFYTHLDTHTHIIPWIRAWFFTICSYCVCVCERAGEQEHLWCAINKFQVSSMVLFLVTRLFIRSSEIIYHFDLHVPTYLSPTPGYCKSPFLLVHQLFLALKYIVNFFLIFSVKLP